MTAADRLREAVEAALPCPCPQDCRAKHCDSHHRQAVLAAVQPIVEERDAEIERLRDEAADYGHAMLLRFDESAAKSTDLPTYISYLLHENARMKSRLQLVASPHESVGAVIRGHEQTIARLRAVLEWMAAHDCDEDTYRLFTRLHNAVLRGDWDAVRAAGVALPGEGE